MGDTEIQAIGKSLNQINCLRIQRIYQLSKDILRDSGLLEEDSPKTEKMDIQFLEEESYPTGVVTMAAGLQSDDIPASEEPELSASEEKTDKGKGELSLSLELCCRGMIEEQLKDVNKHPVRGVLFKVDRPSESAPMIGTGHPLYISRKVAEEAVKKVAGLPLDAHDSLSAHANDQIVGVMVSAEIIGEDFVIQGHLWPYNNKNKVDLICSRQEDLGMSMNAYASGHIANLDGREVFWIDKLELLGANILFGAKATYKNTSLAASNTEQLNAIIAAEQETDMESNMESNFVEMIASQFKKIQESVDNSFVDVNRQIDSITGIIQAQQSLLTEIKLEREEIQASVNEERRNQQLQDSKQELLSSIQEMIDDTLAQRINPSGQPRRLTSSRRTQATIAAAATVSPERIELEKAIARIEGRLEGENDLTQQLKLTDDLRILKEQLKLM